jgi:hypothetical protein
MTSSPSLPGKGEAVPAPRRTRLVFWLLLGIAAFYLLVEHRLHLAGLWRWLPILIFLACPLMHVFGHGGHGGHGGRDGHAGHKSDSARSGDAT